MKKIWIALFTLIATAGTVNANEVTVPYKSLLGIQEAVNIRGVTFGGIVSNTQEFGITNPTTIKLLIAGESACGDKFFVDKRNDILRFFQIGSLGFHVQPGCGEVIEYFWTPEDYRTLEQDGDSKKMEIKIGPNSVWNENTDKYEESFFLVSATVTMKMGKFPDDSGGWGYYFEYSDVKIKNTEKKN